MRSAAAPWVQRSLGATPQHLAWRSHLAGTPDLWASPTSIVSREPAIPPRAAMISLTSSPPPALLARARRRSGSRRRTPVRLGRGGLRVPQCAVSWGSSTLATPPNAPSNPQGIAAGRHAGARSFISPPAAMGLVAKLLCAIAQLNFKLSSTQLQGLITLRLLPRWPLPSPSCYSLPRWSRRRVRSRESFSSVVQLSPIVTSAQAGFASIATHPTR